MREGLKEKQINKLELLSYIVNNCTPEQLNALLLQFMEQIKAKS
ncbi:hypothetical protein [Brevibacillus fulvus]|uniref:Phosphorylcholine metabolism protein LicD n=1 Tax=Brevibacillus fulvus TaxID=1125967 RepID=A0A938Y2Q5_9BACL|nr:hypothetical protein [Brevibacillus fulvus]MBM7592220.1 phosphorylcholine metabolism protein LicD [Brevibacillus fulvus]